MLFSYNWLQIYIKEKLPRPEKLADLLNMHAFEVENIEKQKRDTIFDVAVLPNRAHDCLSHIGIAREIVAITKGRLVLPKMEKPTRTRGSLRQLKVAITNSKLVPRYTALLIEGVPIGESPKWLKQKLEAVGVNSINNVVDITNYVLHEIGQPLHAFDYDKIQGAVMRIRETKEKEQIRTLDDQTLLLPQGVLVIEDAQELIDLAGIKGGKQSSISSDTKNIVLQAANFDAATIYKTKKQLGYTTQAADVYSYGIDPNLADEGLARALWLLHEIGAQGRVVQIIDIYPQKSIEKRIKLDIQYAQSLLGIHITPQEAKQILARLGCKVNLPSKKSPVLDVIIPTRRIDLAILEDLVEEIGRIYGYEKIPAIAPHAQILSPERNVNIFWQDMIRDALAATGFTEVYNYSFISEKDLEQFVFSETERKELAELQNPISEDFKYPRNSLLENLLTNVVRNQQHTEYIRIFELGKVFQKTEEGIQEMNMLGGMIATSRPNGFYDAKGVVDFMGSSLGIAEIWYDEYRQTPDTSRQILWHMGKSAEIKIHGREIGFVGEISRQITANLRIKQNVVAFHINAKELVRLAEEEKEYRPISKFPSSIRDIAILVPMRTKVAEVMNTMNSVPETLVQDIDLFDMYEGEGLVQGRKNLAFHIVYQAADRTLTSKEIDVLHKQIIKAVEENPEWEVRK